MNTTQTMSQLPLDQLGEWDADWAGKYRKMSTNPWSNGVLPVKLIELICLALNSACTNLQPEATRRHIRAALAAGATREEILMVLEMSCCWPSTHAASARRFCWRRPKPPV